MRRFILNKAALICRVLLMVCASRYLSAEADESDVSLSLEDAVRNLSAYFVSQIPPGAKIAITTIDAETSPQSDFITEELWNGFQNTGKFSMIDRKNLASIQAELAYQAGGDVEDSLEQSAQRMGHFLSAEYIVYGRLRPFGNEYRLTIYASQPEKGASIQQTKNCRIASRFLPEKTLDAAIGRAVSELGANLTVRTSISVGRVGYVHYGATSDFSDYLTNNIEYQMSKLPSKYRLIQGEGSSAIVQGNFYPDAGGVAVILQLVSAVDSSVLGMSKFTIPQAELNKNRLSVLPPNTSLIDLERVSKAITSYASADNAFTLSVAPSHQDAIYHYGEELSFTVYADRDCYIKVTHVDAEGYQQTLFPYPGEDNFMRAGQSRLIPPQNSEPITLTEPFGIEYILVAAYDERFDPEAGRTEQVSVDAIKRGLDVRGARRPGKQNVSTLSPSGTAWFSYTLIK
jgi:TolB-like protein